MISKKNPLKFFRERIEEEWLNYQMRRYTLCSRIKLNQLIALCKQLNASGVKGDFVECGTYKGGSAAVLSKYLGSNRHLWLFDSFEGLPKTTEQDGMEAKKHVGKLVGSVEEVREVMNRVATSEESYTIKKGWFETTFCEPLPEQVALLHCDADWYQSVKLVLETFYPRIPEGGCVVLDDFGYWEGCREAFYDFCFQQHAHPLLERVSQDQAYWIKGKVHNR